MTVRFIVASKFHYGPINTPNVVAYFIGLRNTTSLINPYFLISQLRKTLSLVYLNSYHRGLTIMSGIDLQQYAGLATRYFYFFSPWYNGFLTNFPIVIRHAILDKLMQTSHPRHAPLDSVNLKRIPQLPTYSISLQLQHWCSNEASSLRLPQTIAASPEIPITHYHATATLAFNNSKLPSVVIIMLVRSAILSAKMDDKLFFLKHPIQKKYYVSKFPTKITSLAPLKRKLKIIQQKLKTPRHLLLKKDKILKQAINKKQMKPYIFVLSIRQRRGLKRVIPIKIIGLKKIQRFIRIWRRPRIIRRIIRRLHKIFLFSKKTPRKTKIRRRRKVLMNFLKIRHKYRIDFFARPRTKFKHEFRYLYYEFIFRKYRTKKINFRCKSTKLTAQLLTFFKNKERNTIQSIESSKVNKKSSHTIKKIRRNF